MITSLLKQKIQYVFGIAGILFILLSMFSVKDITKLDVTFVTPIRLAPLFTGIVFVVLSILWHRGPHLTVPLSLTALTKVKSTSHGFQINIGHANIEVCFGQIQELYYKESTALVALPANDLFDDKCIHDARSALGAFVNHIFPNQVHEICGMVQDKLQGVATQSGLPRYNIGTTIYFDRPLAKDIRMAFLSVTTVTENEGIRCEAPSIFMAIKGLHRLINSQRLDTVVLPVIGSGHGGLRPPVSLICMLIAFAECLKEPSGHHIKSVRIVVYQKDKHTKPVISYWQARRLLAFVQRYC